MGSKPIFEITDEVIAKAEEYAARGLTKEQIASCLGICYETLRVKGHQEPAFAAAIKRGQDSGISQVANALFNNAIIENNITAQIFYLKARAHWTDKDVEALDKTKEEMTNMMVAAMKDAATKVMKDV